ncbi:MAG: type VI secretion system lipoprotein TssJ [Pseudomonadota bacterium]
MKRNRLKCLRSLIAVCCFLTLWACSSVSGLTGGSKTRLRCSILTGDVINPYPDGKSAALVLRMYELKALGNFTNTEYLRLVQNDQSLLATDILWTDSLVLLPNQELEVPRDELDAKTAYFAVLAEFREHDSPNTIWRGYVATPGGKTTKCKIDVTGTQLTIGR